MLNNSPNAIYGRNVLTLLSSTTFRNHSVQPSGEDELDPISRLDSSCLIFVQIFAFTDSIQSEIKKKQLKRAISMLKKKLFAIRFGL